MLAFIASLRRPLTDEWSWTYQYLPTLAVFSPEGLQGATKPKALIAYRSILQLKPSADGKSATLSPKWDVQLGLPWFDKVVVGDFNGDGKDEVAAVTISPTAPQHFLDIWGYESGTFHVLSRLDLIPAGMPDESTYWGVNLTAADLAGESVVLKYSKYEMLYSQPQPVAVLASPPYYDGQDVSNAYTAFGFTQGGSSETSTTLGVYAGMSIGYSAETPFWGSAGSSEFKFNVDASFDATMTTSDSWSGAVTKQCQAGKNWVIFAYTPIDVYYYDVTWAPDPAQVGQVMTVQIPRAPRVEDIELDTYNGVVDAAYRVPEELRTAMNGALGNPQAYPTRSDALSAVAEKGLYTPLDLLWTIAPTGNVQVIDLDFGTDTTTGHDFNLTVGIEATNVVGGVLVGGRAGFHYGYSQSSTVSTGTHVEGSVQAGTDPGQARYNVGMFTYPRTRADGGEFAVVNYWVE